MQTYDYARRVGVEEISWGRLEELSRALTEKLAEQPFDIIVGIARAGLFPATMLACALRVELYPVRVTRRLKDQVIHDHPVWKVDVPEAVAGRNVVVIDEIADSGETLSIVKSRALGKKARHVLTASLVTHSWAHPQPDVFALSSDAFIIFPWDVLVFNEGEWQKNPEIQNALSAQNTNSPNG